MPSLTLLMLIVQVAIVLAAVITTLTRKPGDLRTRRSWVSLAVPMIVVAAASSGIADDHVADPYAEWLAMGAPILLGMGFAFALMAIREKRFTGEP